MLGSSIHPQVCTPPLAKENLLPRAKTKTWLKSFGKRPFLKAEIGTEET